MCTNFFYWIILYAVSYYLLIYNIIFQQVACDSCHWWHHLACVTKNGAEADFRKMKKQYLVCRTCQMEDNSDVSLPSEDEALPSASTILKCGTSTKKTPKSSEHGKATTPTTHAARNISKGLHHPKSTMIPSCHSYMLVPRNRRIKRCEGCRRIFPQDINPPHDMTLRFWEERTFMDKNGATRSKFGFTYYHVNLHCLLSKNTNFDPSGILIPADVRESLNREHYKLFNDNGICF